LADAVSCIQKAHKTHVTLNFEHDLQLQQGSCGSQSTRSLQNFIKLSAIVLTEKQTKNCWK